MPKTHLGDGVFAERLADGTITITLNLAVLYYKSSTWTIALTPAQIAALTQFAKETDDGKIS